MQRMALTVVLCALTSTASAQQSPYVNLQDRPIKALSSERVEALLAGEGVECALAAELNGYPGPRHVLDLADSLSLSDNQRHAVQAVFDRMAERAKTLGQEIVRREAALDSAFAPGRPDRVSLESQIAAIAAAEGQLRFVHLAAHLETMPILNETQTHLYLRLRGYRPGGHQH